jgi:hypothetical protein
VIDLTDNYVGEAFEIDGTVGVFTQGRANDLENGGVRNSRLRIFDGVKFEDVFVFNTDVPERGGVFVNDSTVFFNSEGDVYSWGMFFNGLDRVSNCLLKGSTSSEVTGMLMSPNTTYLLAATSSLSGGRIQYFKSGNYSTGQFATTNADISFPEGQVGQVSYVKVHFADPASSGREITVQLANQAQETQEVISGADDLTTITSDTIVKQYKVDDALVFHSVKLAVAWTEGGGSGDAVGLERVEVGFRTINIDELT